MNQGTQGFQYQKIWPMDIEYIANVYPHPNYKTIRERHTKDDHPHPL